MGCIMTWREESGTTKIEQLKKIYPEIASEDKIDVSLLRQILRDYDVPKGSRYGVVWNGREETIKNIHKESSGTLLPDEGRSVRFDDSSNLIIEGENLEVLKLLMRHYVDTIDVIYIDPPYNTGNDYVFEDNYTENIEQYLEKTGQKINGVSMSTNRESNGRFHSQWISMIYARLYISRSLLKDDGLIFVSINDNEVHNLRMIMNEIYGEENFISQVVWYSKYTKSNDTRYISRQHEYVLIYAKDKAKITKLRVERTERMNKDYKNPDKDPNGRWKPTPLHAKSGSDTNSFEYTFKNGRKWTPPAGRYWRYSKKRLNELDKEGKIWFGKDGDAKPNAKTYLRDVIDKPVVCGSLWHHEDVGHTHGANEELAEILGKGVFDNPKPSKLIKRMLELSQKKGGIVLDFFAGSGTTGQAVLEMNEKDNGTRSFILVQMPEITRRGRYRSISEITIDRIKKVIEGKRLNSGFKVFKLGKSNFKQWNGKIREIGGLTKQLEQFSSSTLIEGYKYLDVIYEYILKQRMSLNSKIEEIKGLTSISDCYKVSDENQYFYIGFNGEVSEDVVGDLKLVRDDLLICRDESLVDDSLRVNLSSYCKLETF